MKHITGFIVASVFFSLSSGPVLADNFLKFLYVKSTLVPGASILQSCRIRLKTTVYGVKPGRGESIYCRVSYEDALKKQRANNFNN